MSFSFTVERESSECRARTGTYETPHGTIKTPVFMPCATKGSLKGLDQDEISDLGVQIMLGNNYHLMIRPGTELIREMGGLHKWINWKKPLLTDSGGFQVFSLKGMRKITEEGVTFRSHLNGEAHFINPERAIDLQTDIGADIIMAFDECAPGDSSRRYAKAAMQRTHNWLERCAKQHTKNESQRKHPQALFPIIQGVMFEDLRKESTEFCLQHAKHGIAIGGVSVGESREEMYHVLDTVTPLLPKDIPHYVMGVGTPRDLLEGVERGIDMFDCVLPSRLARHGTYWTHTGRHAIRLAKNIKSEDPLEVGCECYTCKKHSKSYLRHLFLENELLVHKLITIHNLYFILRLMHTIREAITEDRFAAYKKEFLSNYQQ